MKKSHSRKPRMCSANTLLIAGVFAFSAGLSAQPDSNPISMQGHTAKGEAGIVVDSSGFMATFAGGTTKSGGRLKVRIAGPDGGTVYEAASEAGILDWHLDANLPDGRYRWDAWFSSGPAVDQSAVKQGNGNNGEKARPSYRSGVFEVRDGALEMPEQFGADEQVSASWPERAFGAALNFLVPEAAAQVSHNDGVNIVDAAEDNSTFLSVQNFDAGNNGLCNQGGDLLIFVDNSCAGGNSEMVIEAGSPDFSIFVGSTGDIGLGTSTPSADLHIMGNELRMESSFGNGDWTVNPGSNGLWFGNNVSGAFPVKFENDAPTNSLVVKDDSGNVGLGTNSPGAPLHVLRSDSTAAVRVEETSANTTQAMFQLVNNGQPRFEMQNTDLGESWFFNAFSNRFSIGIGGSGGSEFEVFKNGNFEVGPGSTTNFKVGAVGNTFIPNGDLDVGGEVTATAFNTSSSVTVKDQISPVHAETVLAKLDRLPINEWSYKKKPGDRHVGPMAEDFHAMFGLGPDNKHINPTDLAGVALAAAKALTNQTSRLEGENRAKDQRIAELEARMARLEAMLTD